MVLFAMVRTVVFISRFKRLVAAIPRLGPHGSEKRILLFVGHGLEIARDADREFQLLQIFNSDYLADYRLAQIEAQQVARIEPHAVQNAPVRPAAAEALHPDRRSADLVTDRNHLIKETPVMRIHCLLYTSPSPRDRQKS